MGKGTSRRYYRLMMGAVVRASGHPCCDGIADQNTVNWCGEWSRPFWSVYQQQTVWQVPRRTPSERKVCSCTQKAVHAICTHLKRLHSALQTRCFILCLVKWTRLDQKVVKQARVATAGCMQGGLGKDSRRTDLPCHRHLLFGTHLLRVRAFAHIPSPSVDSDRKSAVRVSLSPSFTLRRYYCGSVIDILSRLPPHWSRLQPVATSKQQRIPAPRHRAESLHDTSTYLPSPH
jgi:hypothetical protein